MPSLLLRFLAGLSLGGLLNILAYALATGEPGTGEGFALNFPAILFLVFGAAPFEVVLWGAPLLWGLYLALLPALHRRRLRCMLLGGILAVHASSGLPLLSSPTLIARSPVLGGLYCLVLAVTVFLLILLTCRKDTGPARPERGPGP